MVDGLTTGVPAWGDPVDRNAQLSDARRRELLTECSKLQEKSALEIGNLLRKRVPEAVSQEGTVNLDKVADDIDDASLETLIKRAKSEQQ